MCVSDQHLLPPPRTAFYSGRSGRQPRGYPACDCYIDDEGVVIPDPEIRRIPLEDEADPSRGYIPLKARFRLAEERSDPGESRERSQIPGHGPSEKFDPTGRKGSSRRSPRRSTRGGSPFDIGPRRPRDARRYRRNPPKLRIKITQPYWSYLAATAYLGRRKVGQVTAAEYPKSWEIDGMKVHQDFRRQGIATKLYLALADYVCGGATGAPKPLLSQGWGRSPDATQVWEQIPGATPIGDVEGRDSKGLLRRWNANYTIPCDQTTPQSYSASKFGPQGRGPYLTYLSRKNPLHRRNSVTFSDLCKSSGIPVDEVVMFNNGNKVGKLLVRSEAPLPEFLGITNCPVEMRELHKEFGPGPVYKGWTSEIDDPSLRGKGFGLELYKRAIAGLKERHPEGFYFIPAMCGRDSPHAKTSQDARRVWISLARRYPSSGLCVYIHSCETRKYRQNPDLECIPLEEWDITSWLARHPGYHVMSHSTGRVDPSNFNEVIKDGFRIARGGAGSLSITFIGEDMLDLKTSLRERVSGDRYNLGPYVVLAATNLPHKRGIEDDVLQLQREVSLGLMPLKSVNLLEQYPEDHIWRNNAWSMPGRFLLALYDGINDTICLNPVFDGSIETEYGKRLHENWKEYQKLTSREPYEPPAPMLSDDDSDWDDVF